MSYNFLNNQINLGIKPPINKINQKPLSEVITPHEKHLINHIRYEHINGLYLCLNFSEYYITNQHKYHIDSLMKDLHKNDNKSSILSTSNKLLKPSNVFRNYPNKIDIINKLYILIKFLAYNFVSIDVLKQAKLEYDKGSINCLIWIERFNNLPDSKNDLFNTFYSLKDAKFMYWEFMYMVNLINYNSQNTTNVLSSHKIIYMNLDAIKILNNVNLDCIDFMTMFCQIKYFESTSLYTKSLST